VKEILHQGTAVLTTNVKTVVIDGVYNTEMVNMVNERSCIQIDESIRQAGLYIEGKLASIISYDGYRREEDMLMFYMDGNFIGAFRNFLKGFPLEIEIINAGCGNHEITN